MRPVLLLCLLSFASPATADTFEDFALRIRKAHASHDPVKLKALYYSTNASPAALESITSSVKSKLSDSQEITSIMSMPAFAEGSLPSLAKGRIFYLPQRPTGFCLIQFAKNSDGVTGTVGPYAEIEGTFYLLAGDSALLPGVPEVMTPYSITVSARPGHAFVPPGVAIFQAGKTVSWATISGSSGFRATRLVSLCIPPSPTAKTFVVDIRKGSEKLAAREFDASDGVLWTDVEPKPTPP